MTPQPGEPDGLREAMHDARQRMMVALSPELTEQGLAIVEYVRAELRYRLRAALDEHTKEYRHRLRIAPAAAPSPSDGPLPHDEPELHRIVTGDAAPSGERGAPPPPTTERYQNVLKYAADEAQRLGNSQVGTHHLLLGLLREGHGIALAVLVNLGVDLDRVTLEEARKVAAWLTQAPARDPGNPNPSPSFTEPPIYVAEPPRPEPSPPGFAEAIALQQAFAHPDMLSRATVAAALRDAWRLADGERAFSALRVVAETLGIPPEEGK